jgi:hypothetical protein
MGSWVPDRSRATDTPKPVVVLTIFSTAKPFTGPMSTIQSNALASWKRLGPSVQVILFGDEEGSEQACRRFGLHHVPGVARNDFGTPLLSDMFSVAEDMATNPVMCFVNADIILTDDALRAVRAVQARFDRYLIVARRRDIDVDEPLRFERGWEQALVSFARDRGELKSEIWIDWFAYPKGLYGPIPPFAIGRTGHDNWLIWRASQLGADVVDATQVATVVHQRHDFSHAGTRRAVFEGEEAERQRALIGSWRHQYTISHAKWMLVDDARVVPTQGWSYRLARPRRVLSHILRFTRPLRRRMQGERGTTKRHREPFPVGEPRVGCR